MRYLVTLRYFSALTRQPLHNLNREEFPPPPPLGPVEKSH